MRIALLSDASVVHTQRWGEALAARGHEVELVSLERGEGFAHPFTHLDMRLPWRFLGYPLATGSVRALLRRFQPDLVNAHFVPNYGLIGVLAGRRPLVVSVWGSDVLISGRRSVLHRARARFVLRRADWVTSDADMLTRAVVELGGRSDRVLTVPMGVDVDAYAAARAAGAASAPGAPSAAGAPGGPGGPVVVSTRKLEPIYNVELLVAAIPSVLGRRDDVRFLIIGDGPERPALEAQARFHAAAVEFRGAIPHRQMAAALAEGKVYVSTTLSDSTSVSLLEAMASGCFPVVTDIEANREWIEDGVNGFLVPVDDPRRLADRILAALGDDALRRRAGEQNLALIRRRADWDDNMTAVERLFARLVEEHRSVATGPPAGGSRP